MGNGGEPRSSCEAVLLRRGFLCVLFLSAEYFYPLPTALLSIPITAIATQLRYRRKLELGRGARRSCESPSLGVCHVQAIP